MILACCQNLNISDIRPFALKFPMAHGTACRSRASQLERNMTVQYLVPSLSKGCWKEGCTSVPSQEQLFRRLTLAWDHRYRLSPDLGGCKEHGLSDLLIIFYRLTRRWPRRKESRPYPTLGVFGFRPGVSSWGFVLGFCPGVAEFLPCFRPPAVNFRVAGPDISVALDIGLYHLPKQIHR